MPSTRLAATTRRRRSAGRTTAPLGSLTQPGARTDTACQSCGSDRVTHLAMSLTDGTPVQFVSCHACEERTWQTLEGRPLSIAAVLERTRKERLSA